MSKKLIIKLLLMLCTAAILYPETTVYGEGGGGATSDSIAFFAGACPVGWSEVAEAQGRYIVGTHSGGTFGNNLGNALSNLEDRKTGQHSHNYDWTHLHTTNDPGHSHGYTKFAGTSGKVNQSAGQSYVESTQTLETLNASASLSVNIQNIDIWTGYAGTQESTNAPYIQLRTCSKD